jgi:hypothetical protein
VYRYSGYGSPCLTRYCGYASPSAIFRGVVRELGRVEVGALHLSADAAHETGAELLTPGKLVRDCLQEPVALMGRQRLSSKQDDVELVVGQTKRHGARPSRGVAR